MKLSIPFIILIFVLTAGCKNSPEGGTAKLPATEDTSALTLAKIEFKVSGMHCTGCENTIKTNVKEIKGVNTVDANYKENIAIVSFDSTKTNGTAIAAAIREAGYKVDTFMRK